MSKPLLGIILAVAILCLGTYAVFQSNDIDELEATIDQSEQKVDSLEENLTDQKKRTVKLEAENQMLRDSIEKLNTVISDLRIELAKAKDEAKELKGKLRRREAKYQDLKDEIARLYKKDKLDKARIKTLEIEKSRLRNAMDDMSKDYALALKGAQNTTEEIKDREESLSRWQAISSITNNTRVKFRNVIPRKYMGSPRVLDQVKPGTTKWKHTDISLQLEYPGNHKMILGQTFMLEIFDLDNEEVLSYIEQNPKFPKNDQKGLFFKYDGNLVELAYTNTQKKRAKNYEIRIYLMKDGEEYELSHGALVFAENGNFKRI